MEDAKREEMTRRQEISEMQKRIEDAGGTFFFDLGESKDKVNFERKCKDPDGIIFDISERGWLGTEEQKG